MKRAYLILHSAVVLAGFTGIFGKLISLSQFPLVWFRVLFSTIILLIGLKIWKVKIGGYSGQMLRIATVGQLLIIHWVFFYGSIKYANVSVAAICYSLTSFFTAIFAPVINRKKLHFGQLVLSCITLAGIGLIFHFDTSFHTGIILGVISAAFAALYTIANEKLVKEHDSRLINLYQLSGGVITLGLFLPFYFYFNPGQAFLPGWMDVLYLILFAAFCTVALYLLFAEALRHLSAFTVNMAFNLEPIYAIGLAFLIFREGREVNAFFYWGLGLVLLSVLLQTMMNLYGKR